MSVQSVERAFAILDALSGGPTKLTVLAERVGLPKSTVSRLLSTLEELGAVEQVRPSGEYRIGQAIATLAAGAVPGQHLAALARPHLAHLAAVTGEMAGLSVFDDGWVLYLDHVGPSSEVQVRDWTGERVAAHAVSSGWVLLAGLDRRVFSRWLDRPRERFTARTLTDAPAVVARVEQTRTEGHSWVFGELADDINSVAAPVTDHSGTVVAALHVHGPAYRFPGERRDETLAELREAADRLSVRLGAPR